MLFEGALYRTNREDVNNTNTCTDETAPCRCNAVDKIFPIDGKYHRITQFTCSGGNGTPKQSPPKGMKCSQIWAYRTVKDCNGTHINVKYKSGCELRCIDAKSNNCRIKPP